MGPSNRQELVASSRHRAPADELNLEARNPGNLIRSYVNPGMRPIDVTGTGCMRSPIEPWDPMPIGVGFGGPGIVPGSMERESMRKTINRNLLRHAVGCAIFCQWTSKKTGCGGTVLDARDSVMVDMTRKPGTTGEGDSYTMVICAVCADKILPILQKIAESVETVDVIDGRKLWGPSS